MLRKNIALIMVTLSVVLAVATETYGIEVETGSVRVSTGEDSGIKLKTGGTNLNVPPASRRTSSYLRRFPSKQSGTNTQVRVQSIQSHSCNQDNYNRQSSQITSTNGTSVHKSTVTTSCR